MARRARHNLPEIQDKRARVVELRARGLTWQQIADQTGYANPSGAAKAWAVAIRQHPDQTVDQIRAQEKTRLEQMDATLAAIPVLDTGQVTAAVRARLAVGESYRKLVGADQPPPRPAPSEEELRQWAMIEATQRLRDKLAPRPPLGPLPDNYAALPPEEQAAAEFERRRVQFQAHQVAIDAAQQDADVVDAENVDDSPGAA